MYHTLTQLSLTRAMSSKEFDQTEDVQKLLYWLNDEELADLDSILSKLTQNSHATMNNDSTTDSRHYHINNDSALTMYDTRGYYPLPADIRTAFENANECDPPFSMGILPEIETVWIAHNSILHLWHYKANDISYSIDFRQHEDEFVDIVSVALAYPKPSVFSPTVKYVLVVATTDKVILFAVVYPDNLFSEIEYIDTPFSCALSNIETTYLKIVTSQCGRIFLGTTDMQLIEIEYSNDNYRVDFPFSLSALFQPAEDQVAGNSRKKCRKIKHGNFNLHYISSRWNNNPDDKLADIVVDDVRRLIYVISVKGVLDIFHLGDDFDHTTLVVSKKSILSNLKENYLISDIEERLLKESGDALVSNLFVIPYSESKKLSCVVILQNGVRVYIRVGIGIAERKDDRFTLADISSTVCAVCQYVRFPPSPRAIHHTGKDYREDSCNVTDWDEQTDLEPTLVNNVANNRISRNYDLNPTPAKFYTTLYSSGVFIAAVSYDESTGIDQLISIAPTHTKGSSSGDSSSSCVMKETIGPIGDLLPSPLNLGDSYSATSNLWEHSERTHCYVGGLFCKVYDIKEDVSLLFNNDYAMINALYLTSRYPRASDQRPIPLKPDLGLNYFQWLSRSQKVNSFASYPSVCAPGYIGPSVIENDLSLSYLRYTYLNITGSIINSDLLMQQLPWVDAPVNQSFLMLTNNGVHKMIKMKPIDEFVDILTRPRPPLPLITDEDFKNLLKEDSKEVYTKRRKEQRSKVQHADLLKKIKSFIQKYSEMEVCVMCQSIICGVPVIARLQQDEVARLKKLAMHLLKEYRGGGLLMVAKAATNSVSTEALRTVAGRLLRPILFRFIAERNPVNNYLEFNCIWSPNVLYNIMTPLIELKKHIEYLRQYSGTTALSTDRSNRFVAEDSVFAAIMNRKMPQTGSHRNSAENDESRDNEAFRHEGGETLKMLWRIIQRTIQALYILMKLIELRDLNLIPVNIDALDNMLFKDFALSSNGYYDIQKILKNTIGSILSNSSINLANPVTYDFQINKSASDELVNYLQTHANIFFTASDMFEYVSDVSIQELKILLSKSYSTMSSKFDKKVKEYTNHMLAAMRSRTWTYCNLVTITKLEEKCNYLIDNLGRLGYDCAIEVCLALAANFGHERHSVGPIVTANYTTAANAAIYRDPTWMDEFHEKDFSEFSSLSGTLQEFNDIKDCRTVMKIKCYEVLVNLIMNIKKDKNVLTEKQRDILDEGVFDMQSSYEDRKEELFTYVLTYVTKRNQESDFLKLLCDNLLKDGTSNSDLISLENTSYVENYLTDNSRWDLLYDYYMKNNQYDAAALLMYEVATVNGEIFPITIDKRLSYLEKCKKSYDLFIASVSENIFAQGRGNRGGPVNSRLQLADSLDFNIQLCKLQEEFFTNLLNDNVPFGEGDLKTLYNDKAGLESLLDRMRVVNKHDFVLRLMSIIPVDIVATLDGRFNEQYFKHSLSEIIRAEFNRAENNNCDRYSTSRNLPLPTLPSLLGVIEHINLYSTFLTWHKSNCMTQCIDTEKYSICTYIAEIYHLSLLFLSHTNNICIYLA